MTHVIVSFDRAGTSEQQARDRLSRDFGDAIGVLCAEPSISRDKTGVWYASVSKAVDRETFRLLRELECCKDLEPWPSST